MGSWDLPEPSADPYLGVEEPDYGKFENVSYLMKFALPDQSHLFWPSGFHNLFAQRSRVIIAVSDV